MTPISSLICEGKKSIRPRSGELGKFRCRKPLVPAMQGSDLAGAGHSAFCRIAMRRRGLRRDRGQGWFVRMECLTPVYLVCSTPRFMLLVRWPRHAQSVPIVLQKSQVDLRCADAQCTPKMAFLAVASSGTRFHEGP